MTHLPNAALFLAVFSALTIHIILITGLWLAWLDAFYDDYDDQA